MPSQLPPLHPAAPKFTAHHFLRPRQSSYYHPKCCGCSHNCGNARHAKTEPAALPPPLIPPGLLRPSLKFKIPVKKGDNAAKSLDESKSSKFNISKACSSVDAATKDCSNLNLLKASDATTEPAALPPPSIPPGLQRPSLKIKIPMKKGDNAAKCPDQSKPSKHRISKLCSSADSEAKDCGNFNLLKASHVKIEPAVLPLPSIPPGPPQPSLKIKIPVKKGDNAAKCPDPSKPLKFRISKPCSSSADAAAKDCRNSTPAPELSRIGENRKRKSAAVEKRPEFLLCLSKKEIEEDFLTITGAKPPRRPTKRPKLIQEQLNGLFPGAYLSKRVTETQYKVRRSDLE